MDVSNVAGAICLIASICSAQTINIQGIVIDSAGVGIVGAMMEQIFLT
jgi:hypothetical protein